MPLVVDGNSGELKSQPRRALEQDERSNVKIVYLNPTGQLGGAERVLLDLLASLRAAKPDWAIKLIVASEGPLAERAFALGVPTTVLPFPPSIARIGDSEARGARASRVWRLTLLPRLGLAIGAATSYVRELHRILGQMAPDVLHTNGFKMHVLGVWARPSRVPVVWHIHDYVRPRPIMSRLLKIHASGCAAIVANSEDVRRDVRTALGDYPIAYSVHNALDLTRFCPVGPTLDLDALAGLPRTAAGEIRVGLLGTLARWKGHSVFLHAISMLPPGLPVRAYVIGDAIYQTAGSQYSVDELKSLARRLGISEKVGFTGLVEEPAAALRALDIVVHASTQPEPFGLVVAEAMACGRAVIASLAGGVTEIIDPSINGLAYPPGDAAALAERIERVVIDRDLRRHLGIASRAAAVRYFDRARLAKEFVPIYCDVVGTQRKGEGRLTA
jgi:glycosyltransferase involved in cell wall biosynthesis